MNATKWIRWTACLAALMVGNAAEAAMITYTITGRGTFDLGGTSYTDQGFVFSGVSDTAGIGTVGLTFGPTGGAAADVQVPIIFFVRGVADYSFSQWSPMGFSTVIGVTGSPLNWYVTSHAIGPVSVSAYFDDTAFPTTAGDLRLRSIDGDVTFQAVLAGAAVPEPSALVLGLMGLATCATLLRRRSAG